MLEVATGSFYPTSQISVIIWDREKDSDGNQYDMIQISRMTVELPENKQWGIVASTIQSWMLSRNVGKAKEIHVRQRERKVDIETKDKNKEKRVWLFMKEREDYSKVRNIEKNQLM